MTSRLDLHSVERAFAQPIQSHTLTRWERKALQASARKKRATTNKGDSDRFIPSRDNHTHTQMHHMTNCVSHNENDSVSNNAASGLNVKQGCPMSHRTVSGVGQMNQRLPMETSAISLSLSDTDVWVCDGTEINSLLINALDRVDVYGPVSIHIQVYAAQGLIRFVKHPTFLGRVKSIRFFKGNTELNAALGMNHTISLSQGRYHMKSVIVYEGDWCTDIFLSSSAFNALSNASSMMQLGTLFKSTSYGSLNPVANQILIHKFPIPPPLMDGHNRQIDFASGSCSSARALPDQLAPVSTLSLSSEPSVDTSVLTTNIVSQWSTKTVSRWIREELGLERLAAYMEEKKVNGRVLLALTQDDLIFTNIPVQQVGTLIRRVHSVTEEYPATETPSLST